PPPDAPPHPPALQPHGCDADADERTYDRVPSGPFLLDDLHHRVSRGPDPHPGITAKRAPPQLNAQSPKTRPEQRHKPTNPEKRGRWRSAGDDDLAHLLAGFETAEGVGKPLEFEHRV